LNTLLWDDPDCLHNFFHNLRNWDILDLLDCALDHLLLDLDLWDLNDLLNNLFHGSLDHLRNFHNGFNRRDFRHDDFIDLLGHGWNLDDVLADLALHHSLLLLLANNYGSTLNLDLWLLDNNCLTLDTLLSVRWLECLH